MPPGWRDGEIRFDAGEMRAEFPHDSEAETPIEALRDPDWIIAKLAHKKQRLQQIDRFRECQRRKRRWLSLEQITDWCARVSGTVRRDEVLRAQAYADLRDSVLAGEFGQSRESRVLCLHPYWDPAEGGLRLEPGRLRALVDLYGIDAPVITTEILSHCWLPRDLSLQWFRRQGLTWPSAFDLADPQCVDRTGDAISSTALPVVLLGRKSGETKAAAITWTIAEQILADETKRPRPGHGRLTALARATQAVLRAKGYSRELDTITKDIRSGLQEWQAKNRDK
jgi:hypothetical protein